MLQGREMTMDSNSRLIQDLYGAFARGDIAFILDRVTEDAVFENSDSPEMPHGGTYRGKEGIGRFFANLGGAFEVKSFQPRTYLAANDEVMTTGAWSCTARATGKPFTAQWAMHFRVRDGKVAFAHVYEDTAVVAAALRN